MNLRRFLSASRGSPAAGRPVESAATGQVASEPDPVSGESPGRALVCVMCRGLLGQCGCPPVSAGDERLASTDELESRARSRGGVPVLPAALPRAVLGAPAVDPTHACLDVHDQPSGTCRSPHRMEGAGAPTDLGGQSWQLR